MADQIRLPRLPADEAWHSDLRMYTIQQRVMHDHSVRVWQQTNRAYMADGVIAESDYAAGQSTRCGCSCYVAFLHGASRTGSGVYSFSSLAQSFQRCVSCATDRMFNDAGSGFSPLVLWRGLAMGPAPKGRVRIMTIQILIIGLLAFIALGLSTIADTPNEDSE